MKEQIMISAPGKLMIFGEHAVVYGKPSIVTAVDQRLTCELKLVDGNNLEINSPDVGIANYAKPISELGRGAVSKGAKFIEFAVRNFLNEYPFDSGLSITTKSDFKSTFGFGSSSAVTVCVVRGLAELSGLQLTNKQIFDLSYKTVLDVQGKGSGFDIAAAVFGGTLYFQNAGEVMDPLEVGVGFNLVVGYSGVKADTVEMIDKVLELEKKDKELVESIYTRMGEITVAAREAMEGSDWKRVGGLIDENQELLVRLGVSNEKLDSMINEARASGAYGAKLSGAGGGDCMIALTANSTKQAVQKGIEGAGGEVIDVFVNAEGAKIN